MMGEDLEGAQLRGAAERSPEPPAAGAPARPKTVTVPMPDGRRAEFRRGRGYDAIAAKRLARNEDEAEFALIAVLVTIDGRGVQLEELLEMDLADLGVLQGGLGQVLSQGNGGSASPTPSTSST